LTYGRRKGKIKGLRGAAEGGEKPAGPTRFPRAAFFFPRAPGTEIRIHPANLG